MADLFRLSAAQVAKDLGDGPHTAAALLAKYGWTFSRADASTCATYIDKNGILQTAVAGSLRMQYEDLDGDGVRETPGFLLEGSRTNLVLQSQNFGTTWVASGTPTRTPAAVTLGVLVLDLIGDDSGAAAEGYLQTVAFTGDGTKAISIFMKQGPSTPAGGNIIVIADTTAVAERMRATVTWSNGVPSVVMSAGGVQIKAPELLSNGVYRAFWQAVGVVAANTNQVQVFAASTAGTGDGYFGGVMAENAAFPSAYIPTTTATVTRAADSLTVPFTFGPMDLTVLARIARPVHADAVGTTGLFGGGFVLSTANPRLFGYFDSVTRTLRGLIQTDAADDLSAAYAIPAGTEIAIAHQYKNFGTDPAVAIDAGSGYGAFSPGSATPFSAFGNQTLALRADQELYGVLLDLKGRAGLVTRAAMLLETPFAPFNPVEVTDLEVPGPLISKSQSGKVTTRGTQAIGRTWKETYLLNVNTATHKGFLAYINTLWRNGTQFSKTHVDYLTPKGVGGGFPLVMGASQTGSTLIVDGAPANTAGWLLAGDIFRIQGLPQVFQCAADVHTEGSGRAFISLVVPIFTGGSPADNATVTITGVTLDAVILEPPSMPETSGQGSDWGTCEISFSEAL